MIHNISKMTKAPDIGDGQFGLLTLSITNKRYCLCWCDSNNMKNGIREKIISMIESEECNIIEVCTSDTHSTSGKRNTKGYYTLGDITKEEKIIKVFQSLVKSSIESLNDSTFEIYKSESQVMVMGNDQFDDYSNRFRKIIQSYKNFSCDHIRHLYSNVIDYIRYLFIKD